MGVTAETVPVAPRRLDVRRLARRHSWTIGVYLLFAAVFLYWHAISPAWSDFDWQSLVITALPLMFAAMAQAVVVISGGIDLSVGSLMSVINVLSAKYMVDMGFGKASLLALGLIVAGALAGTLTGSLIVATRVPDIVVTLAMLFFYGGLALQILEIPGGGAPDRFLMLGQGTTASVWLPTGLLVVVSALVCMWLPIRWRRPGLALYAVGSNRSSAYLSGINVPLTRVGAYALGGAFAALGGLALTATSGNGSPLAGGAYTLNSVAAIVLGGVSLLGGVGGLIGPLAAALIVTLVPTILTLKGIDPNYGQVIQGTLVIVVVMIGGLTLRLRRRA
jgi:ribose transport system permease protein